MSLSGSFSPQIKLSKSFRSMVFLPDYAEDDIPEALTRRFSEPAFDGDNNRRPDENTPLNKKKPTQIPGHDTNEKQQGSGDSTNGNGTTLSSTLLITILVVTIGSSFQFGYGTGVMNNSEEFILEYFYDQEKSYSLVNWGTTVSCYGIGGLMGSVLGPKFFGLFLGRRATLLVNNIFLLLSSYFIAFAPYWWYQAIGRIFIGVVAGISTAVVPTYLSEISPIKVRGAVGTMHQLGITVGILISQALSTPSLNLLGSKERWQWLFLVPVLCGIVEIIVLPFCPESPSYLYMTKGRDHARNSLIRLQSKDVADEYLRYIEEEIFFANSSSASGGHTDGAMGIIQLFNDISLRKQLIVGITVQLMMQFSGIDAVFYYSTTVFKQAEVSDPELATTFLGVINVIVTIFAVRWMDTTGRKTLLTYSWLGMFTSYLVLTLAFICKPYANFMNQVSVVAMTGVIIFFAFGPGCIAWFIIAEIFPLYARDTAMTVGIFINWIANWFVAFTFPLLLEVSQPYTFLVFVSTTAYFYYFTVRFVPETKGLTITQVTKEFDTIQVSPCCVPIGTDDAIVIQNEDDNKKSIEQQNSYQAGECSRAIAQ